MKSEFISSFRRGDKKKHIKLYTDGSDNYVTFESICKVTTVHDNKMFPGDDRGISTSIDTKRFTAKVKSESQLETIHDIQEMSNPVISLTYYDSGHHPKDKRFHNILESIEGREKCAELIEIEKNLNDELDQNEQEYQDRLKEFQKGNYQNFSLSSFFGNL